MLVPMLVMIEETACRCEVLNVFMISSCSRMEGFIGGPQARQRPWEKPQSSERYQQSRVAVPVAVPVPEAEASAFIGSSEEIRRPVCYGILRYYSFLSSVSFSCSS